MLHVQIYTMVILQLINVFNAQYTVRTVYQHSSAPVVYQDLDISIVSKHKAVLKIVPLEHSRTYQVINVLTAIRIVQHA